MKNIFPLLVKQHNELWQEALFIENIIQAKDFIACEISLEIFEQNIAAHYAAEHGQLFEAVFDKPKLSEGGAFCMYYFDSFMSHRPLAQLDKLVKKINPHFNIPSPKSDIKKYFTTNSALAIPCEEHLTVLTLIQEIRLQLKIEESVDWSWLESAIQLLKSIMKINHEKEERCLFPHLTVLLT